MKLTLNLLSLALFSFLFVSCQSNPPVSGEASNSKSYDWTIYSTPPGLPFVINKNSYFVIRGAGELYKNTNGSSVRFYTSDSLYKAYRVSVLDETYMVFEGYIDSSPYITYAIYDNGVYTYVNSPAKDTEFLQAFISERGVFYLSPKSFNSDRCYKFSNGTFSQFTVSPNSHAKFMGKANGNVYLWMESDDYGTYSIYKITEGGASLIRTENTGSIYFSLTNDIIKIEDSYSYYYFTESGWNFLFSQQGAGSTKFPLQVYGKSKSQFAVIQLDTLTNLKASAWDGTALTKQTNFPVTAISGAIGNYDKYLDNTFLLGYYSEKSFSILKGTFKGQ